MPTQLTKPAQMTKAAAAAIIAGPQSHAAAIIAGLQSFVGSIQFAPCEPYDAFAAQSLPSPSLPNLVAPPAAWPAVAARRVSHSCEITSRRHNTARPPPSVHATTTEHSTLRSRNSTMISVDTLLPVALVSVDARLRPVVSPALVNPERDVLAVPIALLARADGCAAAGKPPAAPFMFGRGGMPPARSGSPLGPRPPRSEPPPPRAVWRSGNKSLVTFRFCPTRFPRRRFVYRADDGFQICSEAPRVFGLCSCEYSASSSRWYICL